MGIFDNVSMAPPDTIFGLSAAFAEDTRPGKVNLGVGIYRTAELKPLLMSSVRQTEMRLAEAGKPRPYLPIDGDAAFIAHTRKLIFGPEADKEIYGAQTVGGTGALRVVGEFLRRQLGKETIHLPNPTWANHKQIFEAAGLKPGFYSYYGRVERDLAFGRMVEDLKALPEGSPVLLHACCHNPTGIDPTLEQWKEIAETVQARKLVPVFDCAYQGFGDGLEEDAGAIRLFASMGIESFVCYSFSKNLGLYGERTGALFAIGSSMDRVGSQMRKIIRSIYSNPPTHGAAIAKTVFESESLCAEWHQELEAMRGRMVEMRKALTAGLLNKGGERDFHYLGKQKGLFSYGCLDRDQVERLIGEHAIYLPSSGRINVTGLNSQNLDDVVDAIISVL